MNNRSIVVSQFGQNNYVIECYVDSRKMSSWTTDNEITIALIAKYWIVCGHREELIETLIADII